MARLEVRVAYLRNGNTCKPFTHMPLKTKAMDHIKDDLLRGGVGLFGIIFGQVMSRLPDIEAWLRIVSLLAGIILALVTIFITIKKHFFSKPSKKHK